MHPYLNNFTSENHGRFSQVPSKKNTLLYVFSANSSATSESDDGDLLHDLTTRRSSCSKVLTTRLTCHFNSLVRFLVKDSKVLSHNEMAFIS